jgi:hypothetical protein
MAAYDESGEISVLEDVAKDLTLAIFYFVGMLKQRRK